MHTVEHILKANCELGEGPLWNATESTLYWTDILGGSIHRFNPSSRIHEIFPVELPVGAFAFRAAGGLVLAAADSFAFWSPGSQIEPFIQFSEIGAGQRFNDGKVDPHGRFWAGSMGNNAVNRLYRLDTDHSTHIMLEKISISNGIGWSPDGRTMYYTDSPTGNIYAFDFEPHAGKIEHQRIFATIPGEIGVPDGLCVDSSGGVWSAIWDGWRVLRFNPNGSLERTIPLPVQRPTSCAFGGANLDTLYITSARTELDTDQLAHQPYAGDIFCIQTEYCGLPGNLFAG